VTDQSEQMREGARSVWQRRLALAALPLAAGVIAVHVAAAAGARPQHVVTALAAGLAALSGIGKRAAP